MPADETDAAFIARIRAIPVLVSVTRGPNAVIMTDEDRENLCSLAEKADRLRECSDCHSLYDARSLECPCGHIGRLAAERDAAVSRAESAERVIRNFLARHDNPMVNASVFSDVVAGLRACIASAPTPDAGKEARP